MNEPIFNDEELEALKEWANANQQWCVNCGSDNVEYQKTLCLSHSEENPRIHISLYCHDCNRTATKDPYVSQKQFTKEQKEAMPIRVDNQDMTRICCMRGCGKPGVEWHHFAPKHLFGEKEAEDWPADWLCTPHHDYWHRKTETGKYWRGGKNNGVTNG